MKFKLLLFPILAVILSCASVPKESIILSTTLGRDLAEVHRAHRVLAVKYFGSMESSIDRFIDDTYKPFMLKKSMEDFHLIQRLEEASKPGADPDALELMDHFVSGLIEQIESYRRELRENIESQEEEVLFAIDDSYQKLQNANSIVTGHLSSVRKVQDAQAEFLNRVGLKELQSKLIEKAAGLSDKINQLVDKGKKKETNLDEIIQELRRITKEPQ